MILDYRLCLKIEEKAMGKYMTDCLQMQTSIQARTQSDIWHLDLIEHKLNLDNHGANREAPKQTNMDITTNEYREFLEDFSFTC
jgi:hypothetical protein